MARLEQALVFAIHYGEAIAVACHVHTMIPLRLVELALGMAPALWMQPVSAVVAGGVFPVTSNVLLIQPQALFVVGITASVVLRVMAVANAPLEPLALLARTNALEERPHLALGMEYVMMEH
jgi:hypothetical protein